MARICSEEAVSAIGNRFELVIIASQRARELYHGQSSLIESKNQPTLIALQEIERGLINRDVYIDRIRQYHRDASKQNKKYK